MVCIKNLLLRKEETSLSEGTETRETRPESTQQLFLIPTLEKTSATPEGHVGSLACKGPVAEQVTFQFQSSL